jgi:hypothetical protein
VARHGILSRNRSAVDEDTRTVDSRTAAPAADEPVTERPAAKTPVADKPVVDETVADRPVTERTAVPEPVTVPVEERPRWVHSSTFATIGLIVGVVALFTTFTGLLAPVGVVLGVVGGAFAAGGMVSASRRGVTGHSLAFLGLVCSLGAIVLGIMAIAGYLPWLDSKTDEVSRARDWLNGQVPWLKRW